MSADRMIISPEVQRELSKYYGSFYRVVFVKPSGCKALNRVAEEVFVLLTYRLKLSI